MRYGGYKYSIWAAGREEVGRFDRHHAFNNTEVVWLAKTLDAANYVLSRAVLVGDPFQLRGVVRMAPDAFDDQILSLDLYEGDYDTRHRIAALFPDLKNSLSLYGLHTYYGDLRESYAGRRTLECVCDAMEVSVVVWYSPNRSKSVLRIVKEWAGRGGDVLASTMPDVSPLIAQFEPDSDNFPVFEALEVSDIG